MTGVVRGSIFRTLIGSVGVLILFVASSQPAWAQAKQNTPFGSLFNPAHTPEGSTLEDIQLGLMQTATFGGHISYMHEWQSGQEGLDRLAFLAPIFRQFGFKVFLQFAPTSVGEPQPPDGLPSSFADPQVRASYLSHVERLASLQPDYLNLCAEVDLMFFIAPVHGAPYASLYREAYALVKRISPNTQIGVSYHMDAFFGFQEFWLPDYLGPQDYLAFTTYPSWVVNAGSVADFPNAFYDRVRELFPTQPIIFSEVGWSSAGTGTPQQQADFISALPRLMKQVRPVLVTWTTLSDTHHFQLSLLSESQIRSLENLGVDIQSLFDQFNNMGIVDWNGLAKPAYYAALNLVF